MNPKIGDRPRNLGKNKILTGYRQVYIIKRKREEDHNHLREVFFQCGNWCYQGILSFDFLRDAKHLSLADIPKVPPALQQQQDKLSFVCLSSSAEKSDAFGFAVQTIGEANSFLSKELASSSVIRILEEHRKDIELFEAGHCFELISTTPDDLDEIECMCAKAYTDNGVCFITIYFEGTFYCILSNTNEDEPVLDVQFPDLSQEGNGITLSIYDEDTSGSSKLQWRKLSLWQSISPHNESMSNSSSLSHTIDLSSDNYVQTYCILKPNKIDQSDRDVMFQFGSWCYNGNVELIDNLTVEDIPHVIPALRLQQHKLSYLCDISELPEENSLFSEPLIHNSNIMATLENEITSLETDFLKTRFDLLDENPDNLYFKFSSSGTIPTIFTKYHIDLIATKSYHPNGLIIMTIYFNGNFYVCIKDSDGDQPLLDSEFPSVDQGKGYHLKTYPSGFASFPQLRKLTIWNTAEAADERNTHDAGELSTSTKDNLLSTTCIPTQSCDGGCRNKMDCEENDYKKCSHKTSDDLKQIEYPKQSEMKMYAEETENDCTNVSAEVIPSSKKEKNNYGKFHHLRPIKKSTLAEQMQNINKIIETRQAPYESHSGRPLFKK